MEVTIFKNTYRIAPTNVQYLLTSSLASLLMINERRVHELLYTSNPIILYAKSIEYVAFDNIENLISLLNDINESDKIKLL